MKQDAGLDPEKTGAARERPSIEFIKTLAWVFVFLALFFGVAVGTHLGGLAIGYTTFGWLSPVVRVVIEIGGVLLITWLVRVKLNKKGWTGMALPRPQVARLLFGCCCGILTILAVFWIEYMLGWAHVTRISTEHLLGLPRPVLILFELLPALGTGFGEELAFRGYIFQTLGERVPVWVAALMMGVIFALAHFTLHGFGISFVLSTIGGSVMFLVLRFATGSLWFPIGFHAMWDWTQTFLVGFSGAGTAHDPALIQISQGGPPFWVGGGAVDESGILFMLAWGLVLILALAYGKHVGRTPPWTRRLSADGRTF
ncbi:MAG: type II CAAX endopeptidase family protein [Gammaproteobacteria bacterium]